MNRPVNLPDADLSAEALQLVSQIPRGHIATYGDLAHALGDDKARSARWLGELLHHHEHAFACCCHRVVRANGETGLHVSGDPQVKIELLRAEGVPVEKGRADLSRRWTGFVSSQPLRRLREFQQKLAQRARHAPMQDSPTVLAGLDVAYPQPGLGRGAYVEMDAVTMEVLREVVITLPVHFPYIPGYLTFRELPVHLELCRRAAATAPLADVLLVDGNGRLHPWRAGIATCLGVLLDHPVIGVTKSLLCGRVLDNHLAPGAGSVLDSDELIGAAIRAQPDSGQVYISVGHRVGLQQAIAICRQSFTKHRLPEPVWAADRLTKKDSGARIQDSEERS